MQKLADFIPASSHHLKPLTRDFSQFPRMLFHPLIDGGIPLDSAVESQQVRSHGGPTFFEIYGYVTPYPKGHRLVVPRRNREGYSSVTRWRLRRSAARQR